MTTPNVNNHLADAEKHTGNAALAVGMAYGATVEEAPIRMAEAQVEATLAVASSVAALAAALRDA